MDKLTGVRKDGTGADSLRSVHQDSKKVLVVNETRDVIGAIKTKWDATKEAKVGASLSRLLELLELVVDADVLKDVYDNETPWISNPESAKQMCLSVNSKLFWLALNLRLVYIFYEKGFDDKTVEESVRIVRRDEFGVIGASSYLSLLNYWFGWSHSAKGVKKTRTYGSRADPIAIIRFAAYFRKFCELSDGKESASDMLELSEAIVRMREYNNVMISFAFGEKGPSTIFARTKDDPETNPYYLKNLYEDMIKARSYGGGKRGRYQLYTEKCEEIVAFTKKFSYPLLEKVFIVVFRSYISLHGHGEGEDGKSTLIARWVAQQMLWAWGGVMEDFENEVLLNLMPGTQRITANKLMFYLYRKVLYWDGKGDSPKKTIPALWNSLCHVPHKDDMTLWLREICPDVFNGSILPPLDIKQWKSNLPLYRLVLLSYAHPAFAAQAINAVYDAVPQQTADHILGVIKQGWRDIAIDIKDLNTQGSPIPLFGQSPHTIWVRSFKYNEDPKDDYYRLKVFENGTCQSMGLDNCGYESEGKWGCVCNQFSFKDVNLGLERTAKRIEIEYLKLIDKVKALEEEKNRILAAQAAKKDYVTIGNSQVPCIQAYEEVVKELQTTKEDIAAMKLSLAEVRQREQTCTADLQMCEKRQQGCDDCKSLLVELETRLGAQGDELKKQFLELIKFKDEVYSRTQSSQATPTGDVMQALDGIIQGQGKPRVSTQMDAECVEANELKTNLMKELKLDSANGSATAILTSVTALKMSQGNLKSINGQLTAQLKAINENLLRAEEKARDAEKLTEETKQQVLACEEQNKLQAEKALRDMEAKELELKEMKDKLEAIIKAQPTTADEEKARQDKANRLMSELATRLRLTVCTKNLEKLKAEIEALKKSHAAEIVALETKLNQECQDKIKQLKTQQDLDAAVASANATKQAEIDALKQQHAAELAALAQKGSAELAALSQKDAEEVAKLKAEITRLTEELKKASTDSTAMSEDAKKIAAVIDDLRAQVSDLQQKLASCETSKKVCDAELIVKSASAADLAAENMKLKSEVETLKVLSATNADAAAQLIMAQAQLQAKQMEQDKCTQDLKALQSKHDALEAEAKKLRLDVKNMQQELSLCATGITPPRLQAKVAPVVMPDGAMETGMPAALVTRYEVGSRPEKINQETVDMMALGTSCNADAANTKPAGCFETANVQCATADQVVKGICNYGTISVPLDLANVPLTYSVLDPGSKVKLQLQSALFKFNRASELLINGSTVVLDRHLAPLSKLYNHESIFATDIAGHLKVANSQYSRYIDAKANVVARTLFETLYGRDHALKDAEEAKYIGVELDQTGPTAPRTMYKVDVGPFSGMYKVPKGEIVHPARIHAHPKYYSVRPMEYRNSGGYYVVPGAMANLVAMENGRRLLMQAARHMINAALIYVGIAYDRKLVKIPSTQIPSGAFSMLPRADVDAVLALAVLYPRTPERKHMPDFNMDIGEFEKDDIGSGASRARAAVCEVLANYNLESVFTGDISLAAKTKPESKEAVLSEAARRVAEIAMLAETINA